MSEPEHLEIVANGIRQHAFEWRGRDDAHLVVMLHGCGSNAYFWYPLATRLAERFGSAVRIAALDHRGCGDSERPETGYEPSNIAADVLAVQDALTDRPATFIGHSRGGWMSGYIGGHSPERVAGLVLVDPARMVWPSLEAANNFYERVGRGLGPFDSVEDALDSRRRAHPTAVFTDDVRRAVLAGLREEDGKLVGKMPRRVLEQLRAVRLDQDQVGPYLSNVDAPTLVLISSQSDATRQAEKYAYVEGIPDAAVQYFDTSHYVHQDAPDEVAQAVGEFMESYLAIEVAP